MNVIDRFLKYVSFGTNSDEESTSCPSTPSQKVLGACIAEELRKIGCKDVIFDENGYIYAFLPGSGKLADAPAIGFIAHMDTSPSVPGDHIQARIEQYSAPYGAAHQALICADSRENPALPESFFDELIVTDGTTLLGADDKAGVAEIITAVEELAVSGEDHRPVAVAFTPDEEIGRGADLFDLAKFASKEAYTVDGGAIGGIEYENFNAAGVTLKIHGVNIHPGDAKGRMKNAVLMAQDFLAALPPDEIPAKTEMYEGFYHVCDLSGNESECVLHLIIRDHDRAIFECRKQKVRDIVAALNETWNGGFELDLRDSYYNMKEAIADHMHLIDNAKAAFAAEGIVPFSHPIRGGTDGARLSLMGLPCPNLSTGGYGFHSVSEHIPTEALRAMVRVLKRLAK